MSQRLRFLGVSAEAAVHCDAEQLREAIDAWQAIVAIELSRISPQSNARDITRKREHGLPGLPVHNIVPCLV